MTRIDKVNTRSSNAFLDTVQINYSLTIKYSIHITFQEKKKWRYNKIKAIERNAYLSI